jgi:hypothetical protein
MYCISLLLFPCFVTQQLNTFYNHINFSKGQLMYNVGIKDSFINIGTPIFVQTGPGAHPASCTMGTGSFPEVKRLGHAVDRPSLPSAEVS